MLDRIFQKFGMGPEEVRVYLTLLEHGACGAGNLSKKVRIPRTTLYGILEKLRSHGLLLQSNEDGVKLWIPEAPSKITGLLDQEINEWERLKQSYRKVLPALEARRVAEVVTPRFSYFEGLDGLRRILDDALLYRDIMTESFWPIKDMLDVLGEDYLNGLNITRVRQNIHIRSIWPHIRAVDIKRFPFLGVGGEFRREVRCAPPGVDCTLGYWAYENKVAFVSSRAECFGFIVESRELRQMLKTQFELIWKISQPLDVPLKYTKQFLEQG